MDKTTEKVCPVLINMEVGQTVTFNIEKMKSIRTQASELGTIMNRRYKTRTDREERTISVKRLS